MNAPIAVIPGDGIGPEVVREALRVLDGTGIELERTEYDLGAERYLRTGEILPTSVLDELRSCRALLFGAVGDPRIPSGLVERDLLLRLRLELDLCVNLRPSKLLPHVSTPLAGKEPGDIDLVVVRENVEGLYTGAGGVQARGTPHEVATQESINTRRGVERVVRYAFELAERRPQRTLTLVHKSNALAFAGDLWTRTFAEIGEEHPQVRRDYAHVDAACLHLVTEPERFDVVVTDNMFGDILTDVSAAISGGLGLAASGNLSLDPKGPSLFEPVHGSAPDIAGRGIANPVACISALRMLLDHIGHDEAAARIEKAVARTLAQIDSTRPRTHRTEEIGDLAVDALMAD